MTDAYILSMIETIKKNMGDKKGFMKQNRNQLEFFYEVVTDYLDLIIEDLTEKIEHQAKA